jgi:hypothetical protein
MADFSFVARTVFAGKLSHSVSISIPIEKRLESQPSAQHQDELIRIVNKGSCNCKVMIVGAQRLN